MHLNVKNVKNNAKYRLVAGELLFCVAGPILAATYLGAWGFVIVLCLSRVLYYAYFWVGKDENE